jgi:hypothetical protein
MEKHTDVSKTANYQAKDAKDKNLAAEVEAAAAKDEPMGSIAAAVPGDNKAAQDAIQPSRKPGAEERETEKESGSTAGTEFHTEEEKAARKKNAA